MNKRPKPPKASRDELRQEVFELLRKRFDPPAAVEFLLSMMTSFDLEAIIAQLKEKQG